MRGVYRLICDVRAVYDPLVKDARVKEVLPPQYVEAASRFLRVQDQNMSIVSALLKFHVVSMLSHKPYSAITFGALDSGKPVAVGENRDGGVKFNVSHQAGLVVVVASTDQVELGVDVVNIAEKNDLSRIRRIGLEEWLLMFDEVLSQRELDEIAESPTKGDQMWKLRHFYAIWALKEAYVKMTGEGLLAADGLTNIEFENLTVPRPPGGEMRCTGIKATVEQERVGNVHMELEAVEDLYMLATCVKTNTDDDEADNREWEFLSIEDLMSMAKVHKTSQDSR